LYSALLCVLDRDLDGAEEALMRAVRSDADGVASHLALARLYRTRGEIGRAIRVHQNLMLREDLPNEQRLTLLADLGSDFRQGGFIQRAIACYEDAIAIDKRNPKALEALVQLYAESGQPLRAIECLRKLAKLERSDRRAEEALLYVETAKAEHAEGHHDEARRAAKKALRCSKGCAAAWVFLGDLEAERGHPKAALAAWLEAPLVDAASGTLVYAKLEATYAALGRAREFETYLRDLLARQPDDSSARRALAAALSARGEIDAGVAELKTLLARDPEDLETRAALGRLLLADNRVRDAASEYAVMIDALDRRGLFGRGKKAE
jgi:lipopolysaccharide biosynthesis regulator YciM